MNKKLVYVNGYGEIMSCVFSTGRNEQQQLKETFGFVDTHGTGVEIMENSICFVDIFHQDVIARFPILCYAETGEAVRLEEKKEADHAMKLRPIPFDAIQSGKKTVELRLYDEKRQKIKVGDIIFFVQTETEETIRAEVTGLRKYADFKALYAAENPTAMGYSEGETADPRDMSQYYDEVEIKKYGTLAIEIKRIDV